MTNESISPNAARDTLLGRGRGGLDNNFSNGIAGNSSFPYTDPDDHEDADDADPDDLHAIKRKTADFVKTDSLPLGSVAPFYFSEGRKHLLDCFSKNDLIIAEIMKFAEAVSNMPYTSNSVPTSPAGTGGSSYKRTGSKQGWSSAPPLSKVAIEQQFVEEDDDQYTYELVDLIKNDEKA